MTDTDSKPEIYIGVVKWFNNKTGYGFITCLEKEYQNKDIFVHHSALIAANEQYKYLIQGEYVEFQLKHDNNNSKHPISAYNVTGIKNGFLLCVHRSQTKTEQPYIPNTEKYSYKKPTSLKVNHGEF
jgi:cold shock CspA family protein